MTRACRGLFGRLFGHKYQPRYTTGTPVLTNVKSHGGCPDDWIDFIEASKSSTYIHDVCVRCGATTDEAQP